MEFHELELSCKYLAGAGKQLNVHELTGLSAGLTALKQAESFVDIYVWGKIVGITEDYFVAFGLRSSESDFAAPQKKFYYATSKAGEDFVFSELPPATAAEIVEIGNVCGRLSGNPSLIINGAGGEEAAGEGEEGGPPAPPPVDESRRLAYIVANIDQDTAVVPVGSFTLDQDFNVNRGLGFRGLQWDGALDLSNYAHFRPAQDLAALRTAARDDTEFQGSFLDTLDIDAPAGCWVTRVDTAQSFVSFRSLLWPGYVAFHAPRTQLFGGMYIGTGEKCLELPFLLP